MVNPTPSELEILQILWQEGECKIQQVNDRLNAIKPVGYTTTLKIMQIMHEKGLVARKQDGKSHIYYPKVEERTIKASLLERFVEATFGGSSAQLMMQLLGNKKISRTEISDIKKYLNEIERSSDK